MESERAEWRRIPGYDGYEVSTDGMVINAKTGNIRVPHATPRG